MKRNRMMAMLLVMALAGSMTVTGAAADASGEQDASKEEIVYVLADAAGSVDKIIVSDKFEHVSGQDARDYMSDLKDVENVKGDEYWQGVSYKDHDLPVSVSVKYTLGGKEILPEDLPGKSGHLVIRYEFINNMKKKIQIGDVNETMHVPFLVVTGMMLDNEKFENIEVKNGRAVSFGDNTVVIGYALPGLADDLEMPEALGKDGEESLDERLESYVEDLDIPDYVEICADVTDLELGTSYALVSNALLQELDEDLVDDKLDLEALQDDMDEITDAMAALMDGSNQLHSGLEDLQAGVGDLSDGAAQLKDGLDALDGASGDLNDGAAAVFEALLKTAQSQMQAAGLEVEDLTAQNYDSALDDVLEYLDGAQELANEKALAQVTQGVNEHEDEVRDAVTSAVRAEVEAQVMQAVQAEVESQVSAAAREQVEPQVTQAVQAEVTSQVTQAVRSEVEGQVTDAVKTQVWDQILAAQGLDEEKYDAAVTAGMITEEQVAALEAALDGQMSSDNVLALITANTDSQMQTQDVTDLISAKTQEQMDGQEVKDIISEKTDEQMETDEMAGLIAANVDTQMQSQEVQDIIAANIDEQMQSDDVQAAVEEHVVEQKNALIEENMASEDVQSQISEAVAKAQEGKESIAELKGQLESYQQFYDGLAEYTQGVAAAAEGASAINDNIPDLVSGVDALVDGAKELEDGLSKFDEEGISKLTSFVNEDLVRIRDRVKAVIELADEYTAFAGAGDELKSNVRFIYKIDAGE